MKTTQEPQKLLLDQLTIRHFRGATERVLDIGGKDFTIYGDNAAGKTTIADAWFWLTTNKDSLGRADFDIKTKNKDGIALSGLNHFSEAVVRMDGERISFSKSYHEVYAKKRGSVEAAFGGHTTDHAWNGVPVTEGPYMDQMKELCKPALFRMLTDPHYFSTGIKWQTRREMLLEICGDVTDADVIASNSELKDLTEVLGTHSVDEKKKIIASTKKTVNDELEKIPVQISEATRAMPEIEPGAPVDVAALRNERSQLERKKATLEAGGAIAEKQRRIATIDASVTGIETTLKSKANEGIDGINSQIRAKANASLDLQTKIDKLNRQISEAEDLVKGKEAKLKELRAEWSSITAETFTFGGDTVCASCGQDLPSERIAELKQKAEENFNRSKASRLETNGTTGKEIADSVKKLNDGITLAKQEIETLTLAKSTCDGERLKLETERDNTTVASVNVAADPKAAPLLAEKASLLKEIEQIQQGNTDEITKVEGEIKELDTRISFAEKQQTQRENKANIEARIKQLGDRQKELAAQYQTLERHLWLIEQFIQTKVRMLTDRINSKFERARFKLFDVQVNGGIEECCEATYEGVPYMSLNHGSKINIGLDIINTLADHFGFAPPIFIDNAESVTQLIPTRGQQIRLVVSANDKALRFEAAEAA